MILQGLSFITLLAVGAPIFLALIGTALIYIAFATDVPLTIVAQRMFVGLDDFTLMSIPLFIFAGYLMNATGLSDQLVRFASILLRRVYAGLSHANVMTSMVFGGVSGVAAADVAATGTVLIPAMERQGYSRGYATGITMASSLMGPIIPPSIPFIIYGVQSETSIGALFLAGAIPGILIGVVLIVYGHITLKRRGFQSTTRNEPMPSWRELRKALMSAAVALMMPIIIIGGIVGGVFTPTEAAGIAVIYSLLAGFVVFRTLTMRKFVDVCVKAGVISTVVMLILAGSVGLNWVLSYARIPTTVADVFLSISSNQVVFLLLVVVLLMLVGIPLDPVPGLMIMTPVLLPAALEFGVDPIHFGVVMTMTLVLGMITPGLGAVLFVATAITKIPIERLSIIALPFVAVLFGLTLVIVFVPQISLWLPSMLSP